MSVCMVMSLVCHETILSPDEHNIHPCMGKFCLSSVDVCAGCLLADATPGSGFCSVPAPS